jgi:hypothetical protein
LQLGFTLKNGENGQKQFIGEFEKQDAQELFEEVERMKFHLDTLLAKV